MDDQRQTEIAIEKIVDRWSWIVGGVVDNDPRYLEAALRDLAGLDNTQFISDQLERNYGYAANNLRKLL